MLAGNRSERVGDQILKELSCLLLKRIKDPGLQTVTLTDVRLSKDLRHADIYYSVFGEEEKKRQVKEGFERAKGFIRKEIGLKLHLRYVPDFHFKYDASLEYGQKIERLLEEIGTHQTEDTDER